MPRYYCDYCDTYLTHDSPSVRKQHNAGYKHKANVRSYYQQFEEQQTQSLIDQRIKEHLGQAAAYQQVGAAYAAHLLAQRPRLPVLPTPVMPGSTPMPMSTPLMPGIRPPVLPRPVPGGPGYVPNPAMPPMAPTSSIPGAPTSSIPGAPTLPIPGPPTLPVPGQLNGVPGPSAAMPTTAVPGITSAPTPSTGVPNMAPLPTTSYQANPGAPTTGGYDMNAPASEAEH